MQRLCTEPTIISTRFRVTRFHRAGEIEPGGRSLSHLLPGSILKVQRDEHPDSS
jgi:hypothetical protein